MCIVQQLCGNRHVRVSVCVRVAFSGLPWLCVYGVTYHCLYLCLCVTVLQARPRGGNESEWALPPPRCPKGLASVSVMHSQLVQTPLPSVLLLCHCCQAFWHPHWAHASSTHKQISDWNTHTHTNKHTDTWPIANISLLTTHAHYGMLLPRCIRCICTCTTATCWTLGTSIIPLTRIASPCCLCISAILFHSFSHSFTC